MARPSQRAFVTSVQQLVKGYLNRPFPVVQDLLFKLSSDILCESEMRLATATTRLAVQSL
jgi:hypothetical protein